LLPEEAAKRLGMSTQTLRLALRQGLFPFGIAVKTSENRWTYYINPARLERYLKGVEYDEDNTHNHRIHYDTDGV
jgi:hypothetical protein